MRILSAFLCWGIYFLTMLIPTYAYTQTPEEYNEKGGFYIETAETFFKLQKLDSVLYYGQLATEAFKNAENWGKYINSKNTLSMVYYTIGDYRNFQKYSLEAIAEAKIYSVEEGEEMSNALTNYSVFLGDRGDHLKTIEYLRMSLEIEEKTNNEEGKAVTLGNLATVYLEMGDYDKALSYCFKSLEISGSSLEKSSSLNDVNQLRKIGEIYIQKEELDSAKRYFRRCLDILEDDQMEGGDFDQKHRINVNFDVAKLFFKEENQDSTLFYIDHVLDLSQGKYRFNRDKAYELLGKVFSHRKDFEKAIDYFEKAKRVTIERYSDYEKHYLIAEKDIALAKSFEQIEDLESALNHYQQALQMLSHDDLSTSDLYQVPRLDNIYSQLNFLDALSGKAGIFFKKYKRNKNQKDLEAAYESFLVASQLIQKIRYNYDRQSSLLQFSTRVLKIYEGGIAAALAMNEIKGDKKYLQQAYFFSESNKAMLLLESLNDNMAKGFAGIPDSLLKKENELKREITFLKSKFNDEKSKGNKDGLIKIETLRDQLFDLNEKYNELISRFENEFPKYYQLKYNIQLATLAEVQTKLRNTSTALIEYFFGENMIYIFTITGKDFFVKEIDREKKLLSSIFKVRRFLNQPPESNDAGKSFTEYIKCAHDIYKAILEPVILPEIDHLVIVADDRLGYLPFGALLTKPPLKNEIEYSMENLSYLIEEYSLSYSYSGTLFCNKFSTSKKTPKNKFLGFAPSFNAFADSDRRDCNNEVLADLNCNENEIERIKQVVGGEILIEDEATKSNFEQEADNYQIIHLATHACLDDQNPGFNKIHFSDDYISNYDLYNMRLNADLAVLSACDTGSGRLVKGEGVMSLARGFIHAGCASVVMSLWSVDDCATSEIMNDFYQHLNAGESKSKAIQYAKLNFIDSAKKAQQHPYYWASFIQIGDNNPLSFSRKSYPSYLWILAIVVVSFLAGCFFYCKK